MAYNGSMGVPSQFMSANNMATDLGVNAHNQAATVQSPNPATSPGVGASYMNALGNNGPKAVVDLAKNEALAKGASLAGSAIKSGVGALIGAL